MTAAIVGWAHTPFGKLNGETVESLIVRVAGYSDYFCDLSQALQEEIIARTAHEGF